MRKNRKIKPGQKLINGLQLHADGEYRYRFMRRGKLYTGTAHTGDLEEAEGFVAELKAYLRQVERGWIMPEKTPDPPPTPITLGELVDKWEATKINRSKSHRQTMAGSIRNHFKGLLGTPMKDITDVEVNTAINVYLNTKGVNPGRGGTSCLRDHTANGANRVMERLRCLASWALKGELITKVPFKIERLKPDDDTKHTLPMRFMSKFFELVDRAKNPHLGLAARLMLWTGLREAEAIQVSWPGIHWDRNLIFPDVTKTGDKQGVAMPPELREYLLQHPHRKATGLLLPSARGSKDGEEVCYRPGVTSLIIEAASWKIAFDELVEGDVQRIFSMADSKGDRDLSTLVRLILYFGVPESFGRSIRWEELDLDQGTYRWPVEDDHSRTVPIPEGLSRWLKSLPGEKQTGRVVSASMGRHRGNGKFRYGAATKAIAKVWKELRLVRLTPHRLRASFATIHAYELDTHITIIQQMMRHQDISTTLKYIAVQDGARQGAQAAWPRVCPQSAAPRQGEESTSVGEPL